MQKFFKYQGTGNDFILIDDRDQSFPISTDLIAHLCDRRFGIGADGLMLLQEEEGYDFKMVYFNSDGNESTMCGNGGRCISAFAKHLGVFEEKAKFIAIDGDHDVVIEEGLVNLKMSNVDQLNHYKDDFVLDTGSPHYVKFVEDVVLYDVFNNGKSIRNSDDFIKQGINVNFVEFDDGRLVVRTYERGVEDETYSCGTGVTAAAICFSKLNSNMSIIPISTLGGQLQVSLEWKYETIVNIWLKGPAELVFEGDVELRN